MCVFLPLFPYLPMTFFPLFYYIIFCKFSDFFFSFSNFAFGYTIDHYIYLHWNYLKKSKIIF